MLKRLFLILMLVAVAAPMVTTSMGCRVGGEIGDPD